MKNASKAYIRQSLCAAAFLLVIAAIYGIGEGFFIDREAWLLLTALVVIMNHEAFFSQLKQPKRLAAAFIFSLLGSVCVGLPKGLDERAVSLYLSAFVCFFVSLLALFAWLRAAAPQKTAVCGQPAKATPMETSEKAACLCVFALTLFYLVTLWLTAYYPSGIMPDNMYQWRQIHGEIRYSDVHAIGHTAFLQVLMLVWDSFDVVILVQIVMMALLAGLFAGFLADKGVPFAIILFLNTLLLLSGKSLTYMFPLKDVPYTFALGLVAFYIMRSLEESYVLTGRRAVGLGAALAFVPLFRLNGLVPFAGCAVYFLVYCLRKKRMKAFGIAALTAALCLAGVNAYGYGVLKAESPKNGNTVFVFGSGIAAVVAKNGAITNGQYSRIAAILPVEWMRQHYTPWETRTLVWTSETNDPDGFFEDLNNRVFNNYFVMALGEHKAEVVKLYFELLPANPRIMAADILFNTWGFWGMTSVFENGTLTLVLAAAVFACWGWGGFKKRWAVFLPVALNDVSVLISTITNEGRYYQPTVALFVPLFLYVAFVRPGGFNNGFNKR